LIVTLGRIIVLLVAATAFLGTQPNGTAESITFRFHPITVEKNNAFHVEVRFRARLAVTRIVVPTSWGSASHLEAQTQNLKVVTSGATLENNAGQKELHARPGTLVALTYNIVPLQTEWFHHPQEHMAIINSEYFLFNTQNALVYPERPGTELVHAIFDWRALPKGTPLFSSFGVGKRVLRVSAPWYQILDALFAGGNFRVSESHENGATLVLAARGTWKFTDAEAFAQIRRVIDVENKFWSMQQMPFFLVTLAPFDEKSGDNDGSGFTNAYMLFLSHEDTFDAERVRLLAHEMFHHWNPMSMGPIPSSATLQWFTEGFTVYYEDAIPLRAGLISYADYLEYLNSRLKDYQTSRLRNVTNAKWVTMSHASGPGSDVPYTRGMATALWADAAIRERSGGTASLDNVMFDLIKDSQTPKPPELTMDRIFAAFARYLEPQQVSALRAMVVDGADVVLPQRLGRCARLDQVERTIVDIGFDRSSIETGYITSVDPTSQAYYAGIRNGQRIFRSSIYYDDPSKEALLGVVVDGKKQMINYSPAKQRQIGQYQATVEGDAGRTCTPF
jgi:predicted metalloprotease with PDZ domain